MVKPSWLVVLAITAAAAAGCGGDGTGVADDGPAVATMAGGAALPGGGPAACAAGAETPCQCVNGAPGVSRCQVDGTLGACQCDATAPGGDVAMPGPTPDAPAVPAGEAPPAGPAAPPGDPLVPSNEPVIVPPEDVATCGGSGLPPSADEAVEVLEIRVSDVVPGGFQTQEGTLYACFWIEIDMPEKHHIIGWEGAVGDRAVHHQQVSLRPPPFYLPAQGQGGLCGLPSVEYTWTGERPPEWTPALAGYPIGGPENGGKAHFLWQTHFEGATTYTGGFNAYITKDLRKYDAGNFEQGDVAGILVPANQQATHVATCTPEMTMAKITHPIYVFSSMLHAHLTVQHIFAQQFRDGELINTFGDETAAFGFFDQRFKPHDPCIEILPGDEIVTTCEYNNPFPFDVTGGEATNQEMCTVFMQYFPRLPDPSSNFCGTIDSTGGFAP